MADFSSVVKLLTLVPASQDTEVVTKYKTLTPSRAIGLLEDQVVLPVHNETGESKTARSIRWQYNIDAGAACRISNYKALRNIAIPRYLTRCVITVRWRYDDVVTRYHLTSRGVTYPMGATLYNNEIVPRYFVIEVWSYSGTSWDVVLDIPIRLALLSAPESPNDIDYNTITAPDVVASELLITMPADLPIVVDTAGPFTTN